MSIENMPLLPPEEMPQTDEPKRREKVNCLQDMVLELMDARRIEVAQIHKATGIPFSTLNDWLYGKVSAQLADKNLLRLAQFFNVNLHYLLYGIGDDSPAFEKLNGDEAV